MIKKVVGFMHKYKKRIAVLFIVAVTVTLLCFRIGIFTPSKEIVINYFGNNKDDFCAIVEYIEEEHEARIDVTYMDFKDVHNLQNKDIFNLLYLAGYDRVCDYTKFDFETNEFEEDTMISFYLPNLILKDGEMQAIIYSEKELYNDVSGDWEIERKIIYEEIDENWYIAYRSE